MTSPAPDEPARLRSPRVWWHRYLDPEERRRVMQELAITKRPHWTFRFAVMLALAVAVAVMGLLANSAAVVIGAMLLAPLMIPVLGLAAALSMGLPKKILLQASRVGIATLGCIALAAAMAALVPTNGPFPDEVISRTSPDIKDLVVALAAGLAGAYATVRADASAALPGVAVAVALVPPLATVGITLEAGRSDLARGALLLYVTNLVAIVLVGLAVFVVTGFVPPRRLAKTSTRLVVSSLVAAIAFVAIAVLLLGATRTATAEAQQNEKINSVVQSWLEQTPGTRITGFDHDVDLNRLSIEVSGPLQPPDKDTLRTLLDPIVGEVLLSVQWIKTEEATTTTVEVTTTLAPTEQELLRSSINEVVDEWLVLEDNGNGYELQGVFLDGNALRVDVIGVGEPPSVNDLSQMLAERIDTPLEVDVTWVRRELTQPGTTEPNPPRSSETRWPIASRPSPRTRGVTVSSFEFDGQRAELELAGPVEPETTDLVLKLPRSRVTPIVDVYFTQRVRLETTTTTSTSTTTTEP
ncbi:MAG: DUF389 domain-containing protein [Acidimicrobiales bacterium]